MEEYPLWPQCSRIHYDFIEIGTADFDTLIQTCSDSARGLSVEPIKVYLDNLPPKPNVIKVNCAISDYDGTCEVYYIPPDDVDRLKLGHWLKGCNAINKPHSTTVKDLTNMGRDTSLIVAETVPVKSIRTLFTEYNVGSIDVLKVDTEGHDPVILNDYIKFCKRNPELYANKIIFETNCLSNVEEQEAIKEHFKSLGYVISRIADDTIMTMPR